MYLREWPFDTPAPALSVSASMARDIEHEWFDWSDVKRAQQSLGARPAPFAIDPAIITPDRPALQRIEVKPIGRQASEACDMPSGPAFWVAMGLFAAASGALVLVGLPPLLRLAVRIWGGLS